MVKTLQVNRILGIGVTILMAFSLLLPALAYGQEETEPEPETTTSHGQPAEIAERVAERKAAAKTMVAEKRETAQEKSQEARQAACERRQEKLTSAMANLSAAAGRHAAAFDSIFTRVQGFYDSGQLVVSNYDELVGAATEAQSAAQVEIGALGNLNVEIDCEDPDVAATVAAFRDSAAAARTALKTYRSALVDLISSLRAQAAEDNASNGDGDTGDTTEEDPESTEPTDPEEDPVDPETEEETN